jgi:cysteine desulfurase
MSERIYLDYAATTPVDSRVLAAMTPYFSDVFGNPSSVHRYGQRAEAAVDSARETVAGVLNCDPEEIIFTSGGTESDNLAVRGAALARREQTGSKLVHTSKTEHPAVGKTAKQLQKHYGFDLDWLDNDENGSIPADGVEKMIDDESALVSVIYANNEIGTINPIAEIAAACRRRGIPSHTDAVQAAAYLSLDVRALGVDLMSLGAHKLYGPKGVGALYVRKGTALLPTQTGGGHESGLRAGTSNVPYIVGFAKALRLAAEEREARAGHVRPLRDQIIGAVLETVPDGQLTGHAESRLPNHASFVFQNVDGNLLLTLLDGAGFACSSGSACKTGNPEPSEVMTALGLPREWGLGSLRVTLGSGTTRAHVDAFLKALPPLVEKARAIHR